MLVFPPPTPVELRLDGKPLAAYVHAYVARGRVYAPLRPLFERVASRIWVAGDRVLLERDGHRTSFALARGARANLDATVVPVAEALRALGASVRYESRRRTLEVVLPRGGPVPTALPQRNPAWLQPHVVFTPAPPVTPRPIWSGSPLPRRTPLPIPPWL